MINEIFACLDGSAVAETILPLARGVATASSATLSILRVVENHARLAAVESHMRAHARPTGGQIKLIVSETITRPVRALERAGAA